MSAAGSGGPARDGVTLAHDYGVMVEMLDYCMGVLLLRAGQGCPVESPEREIELRGSPGRLVPIAIYARKTDPQQAVQTYGSSDSFLFMPRFTDHKARIRVSLAADAAGALTVRVADADTNEAVQLERAEDFPSRPMTSPPCRSIGEAAGLLLLHCWQDYCARQGYTLVGKDGTTLLGLELPEVFDLHALEDYASWWVEDQDKTVAALWNSVCRIAQESLRLAGSVSDAREALGETMDAVHRELRRHGGDAEPEAVDRLCGLLDSLHTSLVRALSVAELAPAIKEVPRYRNEARLKGLADRFLYELSGFEGGSSDYEYLVARSSEIRGLLLPADAAAPVLQCLDRLMAVAGLREPLQGIRDSLEAFEGE